MSTLLVGITLLLTIGLALAFGIALGYWMVTAILHAFGGKPQPAKAPTLATGHVTMGD